MEAMESRWRSYRDQTEPLMSAYMRKEIQQVVDGRGSVSEVRERCTAAATAARWRRLALV